MRKLVSNLFSDRNCLGVDFFLKFFYCVVLVNERKKGRLTDFDKKRERNGYGFRCQVEIQHRCLCSLVVKNGRLSGNWIPGWSILEPKDFSDIQFLCEISIVFGQDLSVIDIVNVEIKGKLNKVNSTRLVQSRQKEK